MSYHGVTLERPDHGSCRRWPRGVASWALRLSACAAFCLASVQWARVVWDRRERAIMAPANPRVEGHGELWLRCPSSTTWYNYVGDGRAGGPPGPAATGASGEWHAVAEAPLIVKAP